MKLGIAVFLLVVLAFAVEVRADTLVERKFSWLDSNPTPLPLVLMARPTGLDWWVSIASVQVSSSRSLRASVPEAWDCYEIRGRFVDDRSLTPLSVWSDTVTVPPGCKRTRYVPEPSGLLGLVCGIGGLSLVRRRCARSCDTPGAAFQGR